MASKEHIGYLLDENYDLRIENGDFVKGDTRKQETELILMMNQGQLTNDPLLGPDLVTLIRQGKRDEEFKRAARLHLERDGKDWDEIKDFLKLKG